MPQQPLVLMVLGHTVPSMAQHCRGAAQPLQPLQQLLWKEKSINQSRALTTKHPAQISCSSQWSWESRQMLLKKSALTVNLSEKKENNLDRKD